MPVKVKLRIYSKEHDTTLTLKALLVRAGVGVNGTDYKVSKEGKGIYEIYLKDESYVRLLKKYGKIIE